MADLNKRLIITGTIRTTAGLPDAAIRLSVKERPLRGALISIEGFTDVPADNEGRYRLELDLGTFWNAGRLRPHFVLEVRRNNTLIQSRDLAPTTNGDVRLDFVVPAIVDIASSRYGTLRARLSAHLPSGVTLLSLSKDEIERLSTMSGVAPADVDRVVAADRNAQQTGEPAAAFFAIGDRLTKDGAGPYSASKDQLRLLLEAAIADGVIASGDLPVPAADAAARLNLRAIESILERSPEDPRAPWYIFAINSGALVDQEREQFADVYLRAASDDLLWTELEGLGFSDQIDALKHARRVYQIAEESYPTASALLERAPTPDELPEIDDGSLDDAINGLDDSAIPSSVPGHDPEERRLNWRRRIERAIEDEEPAYRFAVKTVREGANEVGTPELMDLYTRNGPVDLLALENVADYVTRVAVLGPSIDRQALIAHIHELRGLLRLSPRYNSVSALLGDGLRTAHDVASLDFDTLNYRVGWLGRDEVAAIHQNAHFAAGLGLQLDVEYRHNDVWFDTNVATRPEPDFPTANLRTLFGPTGFCDCDQCSSVLSPAAYLVDLLDFCRSLIPAETGYRFAGGGQHLRFNSIFVLNSAVDFSVGLWIYREGNWTPGQSILSRAATSTDLQFELYTYGTNGLGFGYRMNNNTSDSSRVENVLSPDTWHHVVVVRRAISTGLSRIEFWIDGVLKNQAGTPSTPLNVHSAPLRIGVSYPGSLSFGPGRVSAIGLWSQALAEGQIQALYGDGTTLWLLAPPGTVPEPRFFLSPTPRDQRSFPQLHDKTGRVGSAQSGFVVEDIDVPEALPALRARRPDVMELELTCDNANVQVPYLDLVNEHLEAALLAIKANDVRAPITATTGTAEERAAYPQRVIPEVYTLFLSQAAFPHDAVFDLWTSEARAYLEVAGQRRAEIMETLLSPATRIANEPRAFEELALTSRLVQLLSDPAQLNAVGNWGFSGTWTAALTALRNLGELLRRASSTYEDMLEIFRTRFVRVAGVAPVIERPLGECDVDAMTVGSLSAETAVRLHLFLRLRLQLGWSTFDLDRALAAIVPTYPSFGDAAANRTALVRLALIARLADHLSAPAVLVAQLFASTLDDTAYLHADDTEDAGLYTRHFLQVSVSGEGQNPLAAPAPGATFANARDELLAGTSLDEPSLFRLVALLFNGATRLDQVQLTRANASRLWARASFLRWAKLTATEFIHFVQLTGIDPCTSVENALLFLEHVERIAKSALEVADVVRLLIGGTEDRAAAAPEERDLETLLHSLVANAPREPAPELGALDDGGDWDALAPRIDSFGTNLAAPLFAELRDANTRQSSWFDAAAIAGFALELAELVTIEAQGAQRRLVFTGILLPGRAEQMRNLAAPNPAAAYLAAIAELENAPAIALRNLRAQGLAFLGDDVIAALVSASPDVDGAQTVTFETRRLILLRALQRGERVRSWLIDQMAEWTGLSREAARILLLHVREDRRGVAVPRDALSLLLEVAFALVRPALGRATLERALRLGRSYAVLRLGAEDLGWLVSTAPGSAELAALPIRAPRTAYHRAQIAIGTRLDVPHVPLAGRNALTMLVDLEPDTLVHQSPFVIVEQSDPAIPHVDIEVMSQNTGRIEVRVGGPALAITAAPVLQANTRTRLAIVYDGTLSDSAQRVRVYANGVAAAVSAAATPDHIPDYPPASPLPELRLSRANDSGFTGRVHSLAIVDRALSAAEVADIHAETPVADLRGDDGLLLWIDMREGPTNAGVRTVIDESGSGRDGRFVEAAGLLLETFGIAPPAPPAAYSPWVLVLELARVKEDLEKPNVSLAATWTRPETSADTELLAGLLRIPAADVELLRSYYVAITGAQHARDPRALLWIKRAADRLRSLGVSAERALRWFVGPSPAPLSGAWIWPTQAIADDIRKAARSQVSAAAWYERAEEARNNLRVKQRDALVAYLTHDEQCVADAVIGSRTPEELYGRMLIDNQMGPKIKTSRIVEANAAVQLFLQRCGLNLEPFALTPTMRERWTWMKAYRVWEANRKIFLYPENWLEPGLRDDKTPFFEELERGLVEGPPSEASLEGLLATYLERLEEVADPEVIGMFHEIHVDSTNVVVDRLHMVARTRGSPRRFFYRTKELEWSPWQQLEVEIDPTTRSVVPAVIRGRVFLFWFEFKPIPIDQTGPSGTSSSSYNISRGKSFVRVRLAFSEKRAGGWLPKRVSATAVQVPKDIYGVIEIPPAGDPSAETPDHSLFNVENTLTPHLRIDDRGDPWIVGRVAERISFDEHSDAFPITNFYEVLAFRLMPVSGGVEAFGITNRKFYELNADASLRWDERGFFLHSTTSATVVSPETLVPLGCEQEPILTARHPVALIGKEGRTLLIETHIDRTPISRTGQGGAENLRPLFSDAPSPLPITPQKSSDLSFEPGSRSSLELPTENPHWGPAPTREATITNFPTVPNDVAVTVWYTAHPFTAAMRTLLERGGPKRLLSIAAQQRAALLDVLGATALPVEQLTFAADIETPAWDLQFETGQPYSAYNTELFFHVPFRIADYLARERRFEEALAWLSFIFDPTAGAKEAGTGRFWGFRPFRELEDNPDAHALLSSLVSSSTDPKIVARRERVLAQIDAWLARPFRPFAVARLRLGAFQRAVVFSYLDLLIAWADDLFRRDTREAIAEATQLYVLASQILGERPHRVPPAALQPESYDTLNAGVFGTAAQGVFDVLPTPGVRYVSWIYRGVSAGAAFVASLSRAALYFCVPPNPRLLRYWDTIDDRLFKIHNSLNIDGIERTLALFAPPIPPGLIARALASGLSLGEAIQLGQETSRPSYRFRFMLRRAQELVSELRGLGQQLLSVLERRDGERAALLRSTHERDSLERARQSRELSLTEAGELLEAARRGEDSVRHRQAFYRDRTPRIAKETRQNDLIKSSQRLSLSAALVEDLAGKLGLFPRIKAGAQGLSSPEATLAIGLQEVAAMLSGMARSLTTQASMQSSLATIAGNEASWERRDEEWRFQVEAAEKELAQMERQIVAAELRVELAKRAIAEHDAEMARSKEREDDLRLKFSNDQLYDWMVKETSGVYFQLYQLAMETARKAEAAFRYETGALDAVFLKATYWDSLRKGLLAADQLYLDLRRIEAAYLDQDVRELEITKHVSLALHAPNALRRIRAGERGVTFDLPELLFDMDYPGHYRRRIRSVQISLPTVTGPYASVNCTLTLEASSIRWTPQVATAPEAQMMRVESIVTSSGVQDGIIDSGVDDGRYLPFEGAGVISRWRIDVPQMTNEFDLRDLRDVILHVRYRARDGGPALRAEAEGRLATLERTRIVSTKTEFANGWAAFKNTEPGALTSAVEVTFDRDALPVAPRASGIAISRIVAFVVPEDAPVDVDATLTRPGQPAGQAFDLVAANNSWATAEVTAPLDSGTWRFEVATDELGGMHDLLWVVTYGDTF